MSNVVDLRHIVIEQMDALPPHSRKRAGMEAILHHLNTKEMREAAALREFEQEIERALDDPAFAATLGLV